MSELPSSSEAESVELLRLWIEEESLQCSLQIEAFDDASAWGAILADVVRNLADAVQQQNGTPTPQTVQSILAAFQEELALANPGERLTLPPIIRASYNDVSVELARRKP